MRQELHHYLFLDSWDDRIGKHRLRCARRLCLCCLVYSYADTLLSGSCRHVFRGMTQARAHKLQTSIQRLGDIEHIHTVEPGMIRAFRKYAVPEFSSHGTMRDATVWEWLTVAQHHGLPTRLLDWTHNPMIAAHFVTDRPEDLGTDGAIWCVEPGELNARSEEFRRWNLARPQGAKVLGLFTIEQLEEYCLDNAPRHARPGSRISSLEMFDATQLRCAFLEPPSIDARLVHQQGLFSVLSPEADMEALLLSHPSCARKIIVPAWLKREVRDKLDAIGVSERTLFPGLDGLCTWLRRYYTKARALRMRARWLPALAFLGRAAAGRLMRLRPAALRCAACAAPCFLLSRPRRAMGGSTRAASRPSARASARDSRTRRPCGARRRTLPRKRRAPERRAAAAGHARVEAAPRAREPRAGGAACGRGPVGDAAVGRKGGQAARLAGGGGVRGARVRAALIGGVGRRAVTALRTWDDRCCVERVWFTSANCAQRRRAMRQLPCASSPLAPLTARRSCAQPPRGWRRRARWTGIARRRRAARQR